MELGSFSVSHPRGLILESGSPAGLYQLHPGPHSVGLGWTPRTRLSNKVSGDAESYRLHVPQVWNLFKMGTDSTDRQKVAGGGPVPRWPVVSLREEMGHQGKACDPRAGISTKAHDIDWTSPGGPDIDWTSPGGP